MALRRPLILPALLMLAILHAANGRAQEQPLESPPLPGPNSPPTGPGTSAGEVSVEDRLQKMERINQLLLQKFEALERQNQELIRRNEELSTRVEVVPPSAVHKPVKSVTAAGPPNEDGPGQDSSAGGGSAASGGDPTTTGRAQEVGNRKVGSIPLKVSYNFDSDGAQLATEDDEFTFGVRLMTQVDGKVFQQTGQFPVSSGVYNPRTRFYFEGHLTRPIQYEISFQNTFDNVNLLDAYLNFNYDPRFQFRVGRYKTPFTYEWYRIHVWHLLSPERSLFANNFEGNRRFGLMGWGTAFEKRLEYAVGTFDTQRNSYQPFNNRQDVMAFLNFKPFVQSEDSPLRDLQVGGSVDAGQQDQAAVPGVLRTSSPPSATGVDSTAASNSATVPFLAFNPGVIERGSRALWELHAAHYYRGLTLMGAWQGGHQSYAQGQTGASTRVPIGGWFAQVGYLVTGETLHDRTLIDPLRPFDLRQGRFGLGALELTARYSLLELDRDVFAAGLADASKWTNRTEMTDVGFNWYLNKFVKVYFDWEHAMFGDPVVYNTRTGAKQLTSDLFWLRFQVYF